MEAQLVNEVILLQKFGFPDCEYGKTGQIVPLDELLNVVKNKNSVCRVWKIQEKILLLDCTFCIFEQSKSCCLSYVCNRIRKTA